MSQSNDGRTQRLANELASFPGKVIGMIGLGSVTILLLSIALISLFVVHQVTLWLSLDPEKAFHVAKGWITTYATVWNTVGNIWNGFVEVLLVAIPGWNSAVEYVVIPLVYTALDVLSVAFTGRPYGGILDESKIPYNGFVCPLDGSLDKSSEWCGKVAFYSNMLGRASATSTSFISNSTIVLSVQTARRLSEMTGEPIVGTLDLSILMDAIQSLLGAAIVIVGELSDIVFHVAWTVLSEVFELLFNMFITVVKALSSLVVMLVRSGMFQSVLKFGIDLLLVLVVEIMIPYLIVMLNMVMCMLDLAQVGGWMTQMDCSKCLSHRALHYAHFIV